MNAGKNDSIIDKLATIGINNQFYLGSGIDRINEAFNPLEEKMKEILSPALCEEMFSLYASCLDDAINVCIIETLKIASGVVDGSYTYLV